MVFNNYLFEWGLRGFLRILADCCKISRFFRGFRRFSQFTEILPHASAFRGRARGSYFFYVSHSIRERLRARRQRSAAWRSRWNLLIMQMARNFNALTHAVLPITAPARIASLDDDRSPANISRKNSFRHILNIGKALWCRQGFFPIPLAFRSVKGSKKVRNFANRILKSNRTRTCRPVRTGSNLSKVRTPLPFTQLCIFQTVKRKKKLVTFYREADLALLVSSSSPDLPHNKHGPTTYFHLTSY